MALVFPSNPSVNDTYQVNGRTYVWNGTSWRTVKGGVPDVVPTLSVDNDFSAGGTLHVDSTNNEIGIGTAAPSHQLHLTQDLGVDGNLIVGGTITVPTRTAGTSDTTAATTAFVADAVSTAVSSLLDGAPAALDTLNELAAALDDDASYATTITNALALKLDSSSYTAADVLAKLLTVDGSGSSLDADTLDGSHASAFAASSHTHSYLPTSGKAADSNLFDGQDSAEFTRYAGSLTTQDWNTLVNGTESSYYNVINASGSNRPSAYMYGALVSWSTASGSKFQLYSPHNGVSGNGLWWRSGWNTDYDSWVEVWTSGTDGSGSGLDADLVDGLQASQFLRSDASDSTSGTLGAARIQCPVIGGTGDALGIGAGETTNVMVGALSGEHLWIGAEGDTNIVTSPDNWSSGWAGRYETHLTPQSGGELRITSNHGYIDIGPKNTSYCHIYTDRNAFYFNKQTQHDGGIFMRGTLDMDNEIIDMTHSGSYITFGDVSAVAMQWGAGGDVRWNATYNYFTVQQGSTARMIVGCNDGYVYAQRFYQPGGGSTYNWSDERLKRDITDYSGGLSVLRQLRPVEYNWDCETIGDGTKREIGLIAQEVQDIHPDWVGDYSQEPHIRASDGATIEDVLAIGFSNDFNVMVISAIKELAERIEALEAV